MMNERIRELMAQATKVVEPNDPDYRHEIFDKEKFAELIVKECVTVLNNRFMGDMNREDLEVRRCIADVKQHFGVE